MMNSRLSLVIGLLAVYVSACGSAETVIYTEVPQDLLAQQQQIVQEAAGATMTAQGPIESPTELVPTEAVDEEAAEEAQPAGEPVAQSPTESSPIEPVVESSSQRPPLGIQPGSAILKATSPSSVSLASGEVQLLEFFAFW